MTMAQASRGANVGSLQRLTIRMPCVGREREEARRRREGRSGCAAREAARESCVGERVADGGWRGGKAPGRGRATGGGWASAIVERASRGEVASVGLFVRRSVAMPQSAVLAVFEEAWQRAASVGVFMAATVRLGETH